MDAIDAIGFVVQLWILRLLLSMGTLFGRIGIWDPMTAVSNSHFVSARVVKKFLFIAHRKWKWNVIFKLCCVCMLILELFQIQI